MNDFLVGGWRPFAIPFVTWIMSGFQNTFYEWFRPLFHDIMNQFIFACSESIEGEKCDQKEGITLIHIFKWNKISTSSNLRIMATSNFFSLFHPRESRIRFHFRFSSFFLFVRCQILLFVIRNVSEIELRKKYFRCRWCYCLSSL